MPNIIQIKRTSVTGRQPNTTNSSNSQYINPGELALNLTDGIMYSSNGSVAFQIGANVTVQTTNSLFVNAISANGSYGTNGQVLTSNGTTVYWSNGGSVGATFNYVDNTFTGNGSVNTYTLSTTTTTNNAIVSINGVVQKPTTTYSVSGGTLTFTSNIPNNAVVDVRIPSFTTVSGVITGYGTFTYYSSAAQTTFTGNDYYGRSLSYTPGYIGVFRNGVKLLPTVDYTATSGTSIVLTTGASNLDEILIESYSTMLIQQGDYNANNIFLNSNTASGSANSVTTNAVSSFTVDSFSATQFRTAKYLVSVTDNTNLNYHAQEIMLVHNGSTVTMAEYGSVYSNGSSLATFDATITSGTLSLTVTPVTANSTIKATRTAVAV
jgi:hypothetical protein